MAYSNGHFEQERQKIVRDLPVSLYSSLPSFVLGFHGCDLKVARKAVTERTHIKFSENQYDWLGWGMYFWENSPDRAGEWAVELKKRGVIKTPAVIGAVIDLGNCLNLLDRQYLKVVQDAYQNLVESSKATDTPLPQNKPLGRGRSLVLRNLDCATINTVHKLREIAGVHPYDTVRAAFIEGEKLYKNSGFSSKNHIQICVRSLRSVKGYFFPLEDEAER